jgi:hypothetical protein
MNAAAVYCPHCRTEATRIGAFMMYGGGLYCKTCGWNSAKAAKKLRTEMWSMFAVAGIGAILAVTAWVRGPDGARDAIFVAIPFVALPIGPGLLAWSRLSKIGPLLRFPQPGFALAVEPGLATPIGSDRAMDVALAIKPRRARLSARGYIYVGGVSVASVLVLLLLYLCLPGLRSSSSNSLAGSAIAILVWCAGLWQCISFFRNRIREKRLLTNGELSAGVVIDQSTTRNGSLIVYSYRDSVGNMYQYRVTDFSNKLCEQMPIHVFYDPLDSQVSAALESSLYLIR